MNGLNQTAAINWDIFLNQLINFFEQTNMVQHIAQKLAIQNAPSTPRVSYTDDARSNAAQGWTSVRFTLRSKGATSVLLFDQSGDCDVRKLQAKEFELNGLGVLQLQEKSSILAADSFDPQSKINLNSLGIADDKWNIQ